MQKQQSAYGNIMFNNITISLSDDAIIDRYEDALEFLYEAQEAFNSFTPDPEKGQDKMTITEVAQEMATLFFAGNKTAFDSLFGMENQERLQSLLSSQDVADELLPVIIRKLYRGYFEMIGSDTVRNMPIDVSELPPYNVSFSPKLVAHTRATAAEKDDALMLEKLQQELNAAIKERAKANKEHRELSEVERGAWMKSKDENAAATENNFQSSEKLRELWKKQSEAQRKVQELSSKVNQLKNKFSASEFRKHLSENFISKVSEDRQQELWNTYGNVGITSSENRNEYLKMFFFSDNIYLETSASSDWKPFQGKKIQLDSDGYTPMALPSKEIDRHEASRLVLDKDRLSELKYKVKDIGTKTLLCAIENAMIVNSHIKGSNGDDIFAILQFNVSNQIQAFININDLYFLTTIASAEQYSASSLDLYLDEENELLIFTAGWGGGYGLKGYIEIKLDADKKVKTHTSIYANGLKKHVTDDNISELSLKLSSLTAIFEEIERGEGFTMLDLEEEVEEIDETDEQYEDDYDEDYEVEEEIDIIDITTINRKEELKGYIYPNIPSNPSKYKTFFNILEGAADYVKSYYDNTLDENSFDGVDDTDSDGKTNYSYQYKPKELFWLYNGIYYIKADMKKGGLRYDGVTIEDLVAYFISKGENQFYVNLCKDILGFDYKLDINELRKGLLSRNMLGVHYDSSVDSFELQYIHEYLSGDIQEKIDYLNVPDNLDSIVEFLEKEFALPEEDVLDIIQEQKDALESALPTQMSVYVEDEVDENGEVREGRNKLTITPNNPAVIEVNKQGGFGDNEYFRNVFMDFVQLKQDELSIATYQEVRDLFAYPVGNTAKTKKLLAARSGKSLTKDEQQTLYFELQNNARIDGESMMEDFLTKPAQGGLDNVEVQKIERAWNKMFNRYRLAEVGKLPFFTNHARYFSSNKLFRLRDLQVDGAKFVLANEHAGLLAHDVGFGKTTASIVALSHLFLTGEAHRAMGVVPQKVFNKWLREINGGLDDSNTFLRGLFPNWRVIPIGNGNVKSLMSNLEFKKQDLAYLKNIAKLNSEFTRITSLKKVQGTEMKTGGLWYTFEPHESDFAPRWNGLVDFMNILEKIFPDWENNQAIVEAVEKIKDVQEFYKEKLDNQKQDDDGNPIFNVIDADGVERLVKTDSDGNKYYKKLVKLDDGTKENRDIYLTKSDQLIPQFYTTEEKMRQLKFPTIGLISRVRAIMKQLHFGEINRLGTYPSGREIVFLFNYNGIKDAFRTADEDIIRDCIVKAWDRHDWADATRNARWYRNSAEAQLFTKLTDIPLSIEDLEIDAILCDEAHNFNKLYSSTRRRVVGDTMYMRQMKGKSISSLKSQGYDTYVDFDIKGTRGSSLQAFSFWSIVRSIQESNKETGYKPNTIVLTATPFSNNPYEMLSMMAITNYDKMDRLGYPTPYEFFTNFINERSKFEVTYRLSTEFKPSLNKYINTTALGKFIRNFIDFKYSSVQEVQSENTGTKPCLNPDAQIVRPCKIILPDGFLQEYPIEYKGEETFVNSYVPMNDIQKKAKELVYDYVEYKVNKDDFLHEITKGGEEEAETSDLSGEGDEVTASVIDENSDILNESQKEEARSLTAMTMSRKLALSPYLLPLKKDKFPHLPQLSGEMNPDRVHLEDAQKFVENSPKFKYTAECIKSVIDYHEMNGEDISGQVVYLPVKQFDYYQNGKAQTFRILELFKEYLHWYTGLESHEIEIIKGGGSSQAAQDRIQKVTDNFNQGSIKILIGTSAIREGIDLQRSATTMYVMQPEFVPSDQIQVEGRIWRQGNPYKYVRIVNVLQFGSVDIFVYSQLQDKVNRLKKLLVNEGFAIDASLTKLDINAIKKTLFRDPEKKTELTLQERKAEIKNLLLSSKRKVTDLQQLRIDYTKAEPYYKQLIKGLNAASSFMAKAIQANDMFKIKFEHDEDYNMLSNFYEVTELFNKIYRKYINSDANQGFRAIISNHGIQQPDAMSVDEIVKEIAAQEREQEKEKLIEREIKLLKNRQRTDKAAEKSKFQRDYRKKKDELKTKIKGERDKLEEKYKDKKREVYDERVSINRERDDLKEAISEAKKAGDNDKVSELTKEEAKLERKYENLRKKEADLRDLLADIPPSKNLERWESELEELEKEKESYSFEELSDDELRKQAEKNVEVGSAFPTLNKATIAYLAGRRFMDAANIKFKGDFEPISLLHYRFTKNANSVYNEENLFYDTMKKYNDKLASQGYTIEDLDERLEDAQGDFEKHSKEMDYLETDAKADLIEKFTQQNIEDEKRGDFRIEDQVNKFEELHKFMVKREGI